MAVVSGARRPGGLAVLVLLAVLWTALSVPVHDGTSTSRDEATVDSSFVTAVAPARTIGRLAAEPTALHDGLTLLGAVPSSVPAVALARLESSHAGVTPALRAAHRPTVGDRAPPSRLLDL
jgi:hypothetical protein